MDKKETAQFKRQLLDLRAELQGLEETLKDAGKTVELDQSRVGRLSRMDALQGQQMALEAGRRRLQQLLGIEAALRIIESGDYGFCTKCDEEIDVRRLRVDPTNTLCINCAE
jgi:DnaK suppressor protein